MTEPTAADLLKRAESYLSALHGSVARHDNLAANLGCAGCELRDRIRAALAAVSRPAVDRSAGELASLAVNAGRALQAEVEELTAAKRRLLDRRPDADQTEPADRDAVRDRIVNALYEVRRSGLGTLTEAGAVGRMADAVMAELPESADRAAVLDEAADAIDRPKGCGCGGCVAIWDAAKVLRRMAAEARDNEQQAHSCGNCEGVDPNTCLMNPGRVAEARDNEQQDDMPCPGFPDRCPNLRTVEPNPPEHYGGIRCGCRDKSAAEVKEA